MIESAAEKTQRKSLATTMRVSINGSIDSCDDLRAQRRAHPKTPLQPPRSGAVSYQGIQDGTLAYLRIMAMIGRHLKAGGAVTMDQLPGHHPARYDIELLP